MIGERRLRILSKLAGEVAPDLETKRLCEVCASVTAMSGAGLMLMDGEAPRGPVCTTNHASALVEELQFELGEGPCLDAYHQDRPVLEPDLASPITPRWLAFTPPAVEAGVRAIFGFPLHVGAIRIGALNLYCDRPGPLTDDQHADALVMADIAAQALLVMQANAPAGCIAEELEAGGDFQYVVHQASGMVAAQLEITVGQALVRLRAYAFGNDRRLAEVSEEVVAGPFASMTGVVRTTGWPEALHLHCAFGLRPWAGSRAVPWQVDAMPREALLTRTLVELTDTLVEDFDVVDLLTLLTDRCVEVLDVAAAGLMMGFPGGDLRVMASSSDAMRLLELFELQSEEGPCPDCYRTGEPIVNHRLAESGGPWPRFGPRALAAGFKSVHALPMRLRGVTIGALNLFRADEGALSDADVLVAQTLADVATIAVLQHGDVRDTQVLNEQLHHALNSRIVIEQAKGMVAERASIDVNQAFARLRNHAHNHDLRLIDVAHDVIGGALAAGSLDVVVRSAPPTPVEAPVPPAEPIALAGIEPVLGLVNAAAPVEAVEVVARELAALLGAQQVTFLIANLGGEALVRFVRPSHPGQREPGAPERLESLAMAGTPHQRALVSQQVQVVAEGGRYRLFAPVTDRGDALGVLELVLGQRPDDALVAQVVAAAQVLAYVVIANRRHTDLFESVQRSVPFSLAAEIQRQLLPSAATCETDQFSFAGWLEPASHVGGDTFDYSVDRDVLHVSMTDAMGHGVRAALLATLVLGSLRNSRRGDVGLAEQARDANQAMLSYADGDQFVTGLVLQADLASGHVVAVNAGHPSPYRLRDGKVECLELLADLPFGMMGGSSYREQELYLESGDRLVVITDGFLERNVTAADQFDVAAALIETAPLHPREVVHVFKAAVLAATGAELGDDASVLCLDWHGSVPPGRDREPLAIQRRPVARTTAAKVAGTPAAA